MEIEPQFVTGNAKLAYALYLAGVPFLSDARPCEMIYDEERLQSFKKPNGEPRYKGMTLEAAAQAARKDGYRGKISYVFKRVEGIEKVIGAFDEAAKRIKDDDLTAAEMAEQILPDSATRAAFACLVLKLREEFMSQWERVEPFLQINGAGSAFQLVPLHPSDELKKRMGLL